MGLAVKNPYSFSHARKVLIQFLSLVLIVSTLSAVSIVKAPEAVASNPNEILRFDATNPDSYNPVTSGTTWTDLAGTPENGSLMNGTAFNSRTKAFDIDGIGKRVDLPQLTINLSNGFAIHAVVDFGAVNNWERIFEFSAGGTNSGLALTRYIGTDQLIFESYRGPQGSSCISPTNLIIPGFHRYSLVVQASDSNGTGTCQFYRNDNLFAGTGTVVWDVNVPRTTNYLGADRTPTSARISIQSFIMYNTAQVTPVCRPYETTSSTHRVLQFTTVGTCSWTNPTSISNASYLMVAGGGAGGFPSGNNRGPGGGGAGGLRTGTMDISAANHSIVVGRGGAPVTNAEGNGAGTSAFSVSAAGGGRGGSAGTPFPSGAENANGAVGGSGGGAANNAGVAGAGNTPSTTPSQGNAGGAQSGDFNGGGAGGGGGGAGSAGAAASGLGETGIGGAGGSGLVNSFTGDPVLYAGGGGGARGGLVAGSHGVGGSGGGGSADIINGAVAQGGQSGLGGGGGGSRSGTPGAGGSGVVVIRIVNAPSISLSPSTISATVGSAVTSYEITSSAGPVSSYSIPSVDSTALTAVGLSFNTSTGLISGTPSGTLATRSITITATNTSGSATATFTLSSSLPTCSPTTNSSPPAGFTVLTFTSPITCNWSLPAGVTAVDVLVVAGGGGGGGTGGRSWSAGGGAGGQVVASSITSMTSQSNVVIKVGSGGTGGSATLRSSPADRPQNGQDSSFADVTAIGGGAGGHAAVSDTAANWTSSDLGAPKNGGGGGAQFNGQFNGAAYSWNSSLGGGNGFGSGDLNTQAAGGGAGAETNGSPASSSNGGAGGAGKANLLTGSSITYGGGGGGGKRSSTGSSGLGGAGGGGSGGKNAAGTSGTSNRGGGGGGAGGGDTSAGFEGGAGGSGVVIVRYVNGSAVAAAITTQPAGAVSRSALTTQPVIHIVDAAGNRVTTSTVDVVASVASGSGTLSGTVTVAAVNGIATFSNLVITGTGNHTLTFTPTSLTAATSNSFAVSKGDPSLSSFANVSKTFGDTAFTLTAPSVANSLQGSFSYASGTPGTVTIANSGGVGTVTVVAAGTSVITATFTPSDTTNYNIATITMTLTVNARAITLTVANQSNVFAITPATVNNSISVTSGQLVSPNAISGLTYTYTAADYDSTTAPTAAGTYTITGSNATFSNGSSANYAITYVTGTLTITKAPQSITFENPGSKVFGSGSFTISPVTTSNFFVTIKSETPNVCTVFNITVTLVAVGTCTISTNVPGNPNYDAAPEVKQSFAITQASQSALTVSSTGKTFDPAGLTYGLTTSGGSGTGGVTYAVTEAGTAGCSINGTTLTYTSAGTCSVTATKAADNNYTVISSSATTVTITKANQSALTVTSTSGIFGSTLSLTTSGGTGTGGVTYAVTEAGTAGCSVSESTLTYTSAGTCSVTATKAADNNYTVISSSATTVTITAASQTITFADPGTKVFGSASFTVSPSSSSGLTVTVTSATDSVCTVSGSTVTLVAAGTCTLYANQAGNTSYSAATQAQLSFTISKAATTTVITCSDQTYTGSALTPCTATVTGAGGLNTTATVTYSNNTNAGTATANATYAESANHLGSSATQVTFTIARAVSTIGLSVGTYTFTGSGLGPDSATKTGSTNSVTYTYAGRAPTSYASSSSKPSAAGTYTVTATVAADTNYAAVSTSAEFEILNASLVVTPTISASSMVFGTSSGLPTISHTKSPNISLTTQPTCSLYLASDTGFGIAQTISSTLAVGSYVVRCAGAAANNYTVTYGTNPSFSVTKANQSSFSITSISGTFGTTLTLATDGGTGGGAITFSTATAGCSITGAELTSTSAQTCVVTATKAADSSYEAISSSATNVVFGARAITITVGNPASTSFTGSAASITNNFTITSGSLAGSNTISGLTYTYTSGGGYNSTTAPSAVGTYTITGSSAVFSNGVASNYTITYVAGSFTISAAVLSNAATPSASATAGVLKSLAVSWTAVTNVSSYTLKLYASNGTSLLATITGLSGTSRTITASDHSSLEDNTGYQVSITAIGTGSYASSDESSKASVTTSTTFTLTYAYNSATSGNGTASVSFITGGTAITLPTPSRAGYGFDGWYEALDLSGTRLSSTYSPTQSRTIYAKWIANSLTVTFNSNSGSAVASVTVDVGASLSAPTPPTRAGYTFAGWSATDGGAAVSFTGGYAHGQTANFTLFALWTANSLAVTYDAKGGTSVTSGSVNTGASISSAPTPPTRTGYTFSGWSATDGGSAVSFTGGYAHGQTANFTLFALWTANSLTVTYNSKGGSVVTSGSVNTGASISSAPTPPTRTGYTFSGWSATDGGTAISFPFAHGQTAGFTLFAVWAANALTVIYDSQGGSAVSNGTVNTAASIQSAPTAPTRGGYYFLGWSATSAGVTVSFPYAHGQTSSFTLFAIWTISVETTGLRINLDASNRDSLATNSRVWQSIAPGLTNVSTSSGASHTTNVTFTSNVTPGFITFPTGSDGLKMFTAQLNGGASIPGTSGVTVETWIKLADNYSPSSTVQRIATYWFDSSSGLETNDSKDWNFRVVNGSLALLHSNGPDGQTVTSSAVINQKFAGQWIHVGFTWGASGGIRFYLNGAPVGAEISGLARGANRTVTTAQVTIGAAPGGLIGSISKLRVYEGVLTPAQVLSNFDNEFDFFGLKKITFNANDGSGTPSTSIQWVPTSTSKTLNANAFTRTGYTFAGWTAAADGTGTSYTDGQSVSISLPLSIFAKWTADGNIVVFNNNSGSGTMSNQSIISGTATALTTNSFTRAGYTFASWNTAANGSGTAYTDGQSVTITAGMTLFARWTGTTNTITYDSKSGSAVSNGSFVTGGSISAAPSAPTRAGYTLSGWSLTDGGSVITYPYSPTATSGITLYAIWAAISCSPTSATTGGYTIYTFTTAGTCFWTVPAGLTDVEILAVGGGGGGGYAWDNTGAGGGAGGQVKTGTATLSTTLEVTVGAGGSAGTTTSRRGGTGESSSVSTLVALGGTGGCSARSAVCSIATQATALAGATGGAGGAGGASGRGGGGSNTAGVAPTTTTGGTGTASTYSGSSVTYGVGGAGGTGRAFTSNVTGASGATNTGNGGAGASSMNSSGDVNGGAGAAGIVVIRVASALTVTFDSQSGSAVSDVSTFTGATIATAPTAPTRATFTFVGWFTATTGGSAITFPYTHGQTANFTLFARWALNTYAIAFDKNHSDTGTGAMVNQSVTHGLAANLNANLFTRANYVFHRWATETNGSGSTFNNLAQITLTAGTTLYAQWTANTYVVTFNYNNATGGNSTATSSFITGGSPIVLPTPSRTGFDFGGWHSDTALLISIGSAGANYSPTGTVLSLTAFAKWTAINYTFIYDRNSAPIGSGTVPTETTKQITQTVVVQANTGNLVRAGYTFDGWNTSSDGTGTNYLSGSIFTVASANVLLFAKWTPNTYTITYNSNGGSGSAQRSSTNVLSDTFTSGNSGVVLPGAGTLTRSGYTFDGWNTSAAGNGTNRAVGATFTTVSDVIFYATWNPVTYAITYDANSGTGTAPTAGSYTTGQALPYVVLANTFTKASSVFGGWNTANNGTGISYSPGATITTLAPITLFAVWIPQFTLHYAINGGTVNVGSTLPADALLTQNTPVAVFSALGRAGYTFDGWTNGQATILPNGSFNINADSVLTAKWTAINYSISYVSDGGTTPPSSITRQIGQSYAIGDAPSKPGHDFVGWKTGSTVVGAGATIVMGSSSVIYTAQWAAQVYTVTYDWNGGRGTAEANVNYTFGTTAISLPLVGNRVRDGFNFAGWSESLGGNALGATYIPTQSRTLYARWILGNFTVTYDAGRGTVANSSVPVPNGGSTSFPLPTRANFVFTGWYSATTGGTLIGMNGATFAPLSSQTVYARWVQSSLFGITDSLTRIGSVVTVDNVSNTFSGANSNSSVSVSVPANALPAGTTINFDLVGNSSRATGLLPGISYVVSIAVSWLTGDETVPDTASGKQISVTITNSSIKAGAVAYAIVNNVSTLLGTATQDGSITVALTADPEVVVVATKPAAPQNVIATSNGAQQSLVSWSVPSSTGGSAITEYVATATPGGGTCTTSTTSCSITNLLNATAYSFTVTAKNNVGVSEVSTAATATTAGLHAVAFDAKGGSTVTSGSFLTTSTVSEPTAPTRAGYSFAGWSATDGGSVVTFPYAPGVATDITMFARWDALDNVVTFDSKNGSAVADGVFSSGGTVTAPTAPTRSGFTFAGWSATDGGAAVTFPYAPGVVTDITLYSRWTVVSQNNTGGGGSTPVPSEPANPSTPVRSNVTVVAPVTIVGDQETKLIAVQITTPTTGSDVKPPAIKLDAASEKIIAEIKVVEGKLVLTPEAGFSGRRTVTVTVTENGADRFIQIPLTVLPEVVTRPVLTPTASNRTNIRWTQSPNATAYTVLLNGRRICSTSASSCSVSQVLGPNAVIEIISNGGDRTVSERIEADFRQNVPVPITRLVSATITKSTLSRVDTRALDRVVSLIRSQGFGTIVISEITTTSRTAALAAARIAAIKKYIDDRTGSREITFELVPPTSRTNFNNISVKG